MTFRTLKTHKIPVARIVGPHATERIISSHSACHRPGRTAPDYRGNCFAHHTLAGRVQERWRRSSELRSCHADPKNKKDEQHTEHRNT